MAGNKLAAASKAPLAAPKPTPPVVEPPKLAVWKVGQLRALRVVLEENTQAEIVGGFDGQLLPVFVRQDTIGGRSLSFVNVVDTAAVNPAAKSQTNYILCYDGGSNTWMSLT